MSKRIVNRTDESFQLQFMLIGIELTHRVYALLECDPSLSCNKHVVSANECAKKWNETFVEYVTSCRTKGGK
mgnify:CR=1 FL=1